MTKLVRLKFLDQSDEIPLWLKHLPELSGGGFCLRRDGLYEREGALMQGLRGGDDVEG